MVISDHLDWKDEEAHLVLLQEKINAYLAILQDEKWVRKKAKGAQYVNIMIFFLSDITENCEKFLQAVQDQVGQYGVKITATIADDGFRNDIDQAMSKENQAQEDTSPTENQQPKKRGFPFFGKRDK